MPNRTTQQQRTPRGSGWRKAGLLAMSLAATTTAGLPAVGHAAMIETRSVAPSMAAEASPENARALLDATIARADVRELLLDQGIAPEEAGARIDALNDQEVVQLAQHIETAPAGQGVIIAGIVVGLIVVLIAALTD